MDDSKIKTGDTVKVINDSFHRGRIGVVVLDNVYHEVLKINVHLVRIGAFSGEFKQWFTSYQLEKI